jgi:hypothetical protein
MEVYRFITWTWGRETEQSSYRQEGRLSYSMLAKIQRSATARKHDGLVDPYSGECMFNSIVLDVAIGMVFVYLLLSLLCTAVLEVIATTFKLRAKNLEAGIRSLFSDGFGPGGEAFVKQIYDHGLVAGLYRDTGVDLQVASAGGYQKPSKPGTRQLPSYIPSRTFALSLIDILNTARGFRTAKQNRHYSVFSLMQMEKLSNYVDTLKTGTTMRWIELPDGTKSGRNTSC